MRARLALPGLPDQRGPGGQPGPFGSDPVVADRLRELEPLVNYLAYKKRPGCPLALASAWIGAWQAASRFNPAAGVKLKTFASRRISGAILDRERTEERGRRRADGSIRPKDKLMPWHMKPLDVVDGTLGGPGKDRGGKSQGLDDDRARPPEAAMEDHEFWGSIVQLLDPRSALVIILYYRCGLTLRQVGEVLGMSESRVCQLKRAALDQLRAKLPAPDQVCTK